MKRVVKAFNKEGLSKFRSFLENQQFELAAPPPYDYLDMPSLTTSVDGYAEIDDTVVFGTRLEAGKYFCNVLTGLRDSENQNLGMWAWLSLLYYDHLCPPLSKGFRKPGKVYGYIPSELYTEYYRHKLLGPYNLYKLHNKYAAALLSNPPHIVGEINEQIASRQTIVANVEMMKSIHQLYYDEKNSSFKRGATTRRKGGTVDRFWRVKEQLDWTYDFFSMSSEEILSLLPTEFKPWWKNA
jgi:hypothetical protein